MKYLLMIYGNQEKWESVPPMPGLRRSPDRRLFGTAQVDLRCIETIHGEGAVHPRFETR